MRRISAFPREVPLSIDAISTYEAPFPAVAVIKDHLAFYRDRVDTIEEN